VPIAQLGISRILRLSVFMTCRNQGIAKIHLPHWSGIVSIYMQWLAGLKNPNIERRLAAAIQ